VKFCEIGDQLRGKLRMRSNMFFSR